METHSPMTPNQLGQSFCPSEYESAGEGDISDNSLYFSICDDGNMSMNMSINKENSSSNGGRRSVAELNMSSGFRKSKTATPLLRKVLVDPSNKTPRNKNNKRVSFSQSPKTNPITEMPGKVAKVSLTGVNESNESNEPTDNGNSEKKRFQLTPGKELKKRSLIGISEIGENETMSSAALTVDNVSKFAIEQSESTDSINSTESKMENGESHFSLNSTASTDDIEKEQMHTTIIENAVHDADQTLISSNGTTTSPETIIANKIEMNEIDSKNVESIVEENPSQKVEQESTIEPTVSLAETLANAMNLDEKNRKKSLGKSPATVSLNKPVVTAADLLNKLKSVAGTSIGTNNAARLSRAQLASDSRKSILPVAKKPPRPSVVKRRSGTFETRKIDRRTTVARMSMAKPATPKLSVLPSTSKPAVEQPAAQKTTVPNKIPKSNDPKMRTNLVTVGPKQAITEKPSSQPGTSSVPTTMKSTMNKPRISTRMSTARYSIYTTRQTATLTSNSRTVQIPRVQNRSTINATSTSKVTSSTSSTSSVSTTTASTTSSNEKFVKPSIPRPMNKPKLPESKLPTVNSTTFKCKYCDRTFAKNFGLDQHLSENCEKIPASHRRLLLKNQSDKAETKTRKHESDLSNYQSQRPNETWKHSRFFVEKFNQAVSNSHSDSDASTKNMESGLNSLRNELKLLSNAHSGVKRTPKKAIKCLTCSTFFWDCVEYAIHKTTHYTAEHQQQI